MQIRIATESEKITTNDKGDNLFVNATEMAKFFGKSVKDWTRLQSTKEFLNALKSVKGHICLLKVIKGDNLFVNATEMAKAFNRRVNDFLRLKATEDYIKVISVDTGIPATALIQTVRGGLCIYHFNV